MVGKATLVKTLNFGDITINTEARVPKWSVKMVFLTVSQNSQERSMSESLKVAGYWLIKI